MKRIVLGVVVVLAAFLLFAPDLWAHGGQFRGPGGAVPPGLREPTDPTPPPPPPPSGPPTTPTPTTPTPRPTPTPTTPSQAPPQTPVETPEQRGPRRTQPSFEDWTFWYHNNKDDIENLKRALYALMSSDNPLFQPGRYDETSRTSATRLTAKKVEETVLPTLLWAMDPDNANHQDVESAAYIALAKLARDPDQIRTIETGLDKERNRDQIVQESAALALGLLRRAEKTDQFTARELDRVRTFLFDVFADDDYATRVRGFAALAIGLLGGQPTGSGEYATDAAAAATATTETLFELLQGKYTNYDLYISLFMAIGLQPPASVSERNREVLADCALKGRLYRDSPNALVRAYAAQALGRVGTANDRKTLENILQARRGMDANIQRSAAIGLGLLGRHVSGEERVAVADTLLRGANRAKDNSTKNFAIISLAYLLLEDIRAGTTDVIGSSEADEYLLETASKGKYLQRPFGALALGLVVREITDELDVEAYQVFKESALQVLRDGLVDTKLDTRGQAAFCTAIGIAQDGRSKETLRQILVGGGDKELRGYAALGLGLIGQRTPEVVKAIADALRERSSEELRRQTAVALGLLGNPKIPGTNMDAVELLIEELKEAKSQNHKGQIVLALARVGDHRAVDHLVGLLKDPDEQYLTRALSCAGLGLIGDLEWLSSLARLSKHVNYRASTDIVNEVLSIL